MDRHEPGGHRGLRSRLNADIAAMGPEERRDYDLACEALKADPYAYFRMLNECFDLLGPHTARAAARYTHAVVTQPTPIPPATPEGMTPITIAESKLGDLASAGRGASHSDIIEIRALVREAANESGKGPMGL